VAAIVLDTRVLAVAPVIASETGARPGIIIIAAAFTGARAAETTTSALYEK
jgi:hypothetical protein